MRSVLIGCLEIAKRFDVPNKKLTQINCQILGKGNGSQQFFRDLPLRDVGGGGSRVPLGIYKKKHLRSLRIEDCGNT